MNLPNKITVLRIFMIPFFMIFLYVPIWGRYVATALFVLAAATDWVDGYIARKHNLVTNFGKFADPLADKILVVAAFLCFVQLGIMGAVPVIIVLFREFSVTSIRLVAASNGDVVAANIWGKIKTVSQIIAIGFILLFQYILQLVNYNIIKLTPENINGLTYGLNITSEVLIYISVVLTLISGVIYIKDNFKFIKNTKWN